MGFPNLVQGAANQSGGMAALAALRGASEGFDAIRRWPRRFDLMPGASTASDGQIVGALERGIADQRIVMLYVADRPPPVMHGWDAALARRAPGPRLAAGAAQTAAQKADAAVAALSATDKVLMALEKGLRGLGNQFGDLIDQFLEPENLLKVAGFFLATALVGLAANTNPISAAIFDGAMVGFVYYSAGRLGVESLMLLYEAVVSASNATTTAEIDKSGKDLSKAIIGLGGAVFLGWLARRLYLKAKARVQARQQPAPQEPLPPAKTVPREGTQPTQAAAPAAAQTTARGGTYVLRDANGNVVRSGRTNNLARRQAEHARDPNLNKFRFEEVHRTDNYAQQRGLEQLLDKHYNPPLNKIRPISPNNPNLGKYEEAAKKFLEGGGP